MGSKNIEYFGGNPSDVTLAGQSAGAASVMYLKDSTTTTGLFHRTITSAGDSLGGWTLNRKPKNASLNAIKLMNCYFEYANGTEDEQKIMECMLKKTAEELIKASGSHWVPCIQTWLDADNAIVAKDPYAAIQTAQNIPMLIGNNANDGSCMLARFYKDLEVESQEDTTFVRDKLLNQTLLGRRFGMSMFPVGNFEALGITYFGNARDTDNLPSKIPGLVDLFSTYYFKAPTNHRILYQNATANIFAYLFNFIGNVSVYQECSDQRDSIVPKSIGAGHIDDLKYIFKMKVLNSNRERQIREKMVNIYTNFVQMGHPTADSTKWPAFTSKDKLFQVIGEVNDQLCTDYVNTYIRGHLDNTCSAIDQRDERKI